MLKCTASSLRNGGLRAPRSVCCLQTASASFDLKMCFFHFPRNINSFRNGKLTLRTAADSAFSAGVLVCYLKEQQALQGFCRAHPGLRDAIYSAIIENRVQGCDSEMGKRYSSEACWSPPHGLWGYVLSAGQGTDTWIRGGLMTLKGNSRGKIRNILWRIIGFECILPGNLSYSYPPKLDLELYTY